MARVHQSSQFPDHDQQPKQTYSPPVTRGRGRGENVAVNCWECGDPGHISRNCPVRNHAWRGNRASSSDPSKADAKDTTSGTPKVRAKPMNTSTEVSLNVEPVKVSLPQKNVNISLLQATIEQKEKELQLCGQKIDTLNSQLNKATTDLKCARAKNEDMAINVNSLQQELENCRKELSSLKDKDEAWAHKYRCLNEDMALNVKTLEQQLEKYKKELSSLKDKDEAWAHKYRCLNEHKALNVKILEQQLEKYKNELSSLKNKDEAWAHKYQCLNEDKALNVKRLEQQLVKCKKELSSLKDKDEAWAKKYWCLNEDKALNVKRLEQQLEKYKKELSSLKDKDEAWAHKYRYLNVQLEKYKNELSSLKDKDEAWAHKYRCLNEDKALNVKRLEQQLEKYKNELSSLKDKDEAWAHKYQCLNEDKALNVKRLEQQLEKYKKELSSLKDKDEAWAHKYQCLNEDKALNVKRLEQQLEKYKKELSSLKDKDEAWAHKYRCLNEHKALNVKILEQQLEKYKKELSSLKDKDEAWAHKYRCLNADNALNVKILEQQLVKCKKELSSLKDKDEAWAHKYRCLNDDMALNVKRLEQQLEKYKKELSSLKDKDEAWSKKYWCLNEDMAGNMNVLEQQLEKCNKEISYLKDKNEAWLHKYWAKKWWGMNEDMALNVNSLEEELEQCRKELTCLKDNDEVWAHKYRCLNEDMALDVKRLEQTLEKYKKELSSLKDKDEAWAHKYRCLNEDKALNVKRLEQQLEKCKKELSSLKDKDEAWVKKLWALNKEFAETKHELNEKIKHLEEANETADDEISMQKLETEKWRKTAKAIASVLVGNAELCSKTSELESFVLYYTNRAAKRMSLKKFRKAMDDCKMATYLDPGSLKARLIAGNCHLVLGEIDEALCCYKKCLDSGMVCFDRRLTLEASDGLQNAEKVINLINQSAELLQLKSFESATHALEIITEALSISCYSEKLLELKGEALFRLQKYEEVVELCEQTLAIAEKNCTTTSNSDCLSDEDRNRLLNCWRLSLMSRSYFCMAKFDMALATLDKYEQLAPPETMTKGPSSFSAATVRELLRIKTAGNDAYQTGKYREAVEHYSNAIMRSIESRHFTAICLCNRAAAHQALGKVIDAIADCNLAIALDGDYMKAISRRANLHEKIRDYEEAALDLQMLVCLLEKHSEKKHLEELTIARRRLSSANSNVKKGMTMDLYLILGLKGSESGSEIKKAYHKAALKHHPDKAGKFLARSESGAEGDVLKEIFTTIQKDADKLFKIIGEAYAVLSDANKRFKYNL